MATRKTGFLLISFLSLKCQPSPRPKPWARETGAWVEGRGDSWHFRLFVPQLVENNTCTIFLVLHFTHGKKWIEGETGGDTVCYSTAYYGSLTWTYDKKGPACQHYTFTCQSTAAKARAPNKIVYCCRMLQRFFKRWTPQVFFLMPYWSHKLQE